MIELQVGVIDLVHGHPVFCRTSDC